MSGCSHPSDLGPSDRQDWALGKEGPAWGTWREGPWSMKQNASQCRRLKGKASFILKTGLNSTLGISYCFGIAGQGSDNHSISTEITCLFPPFPTIPGDPGVNEIKQNENG